MRRRTFSEGNVQNASWSKGREKLKREKLEASHPERAVSLRVSFARLQEKEGSFYRFQTWSILAVTEH